MDTALLKKFTQKARRQLLEQVGARLEQVLRLDSVEIREKAKVVEELKEQIAKHGKKRVIDRVAYTWFNRFCALRFMDVNHYTRIGAVSPVEGGTQPEVLLEAKQGHIDDELGKYVNHQVVFDLLSGRRPSSNAQGEAYRLLLVGICNYYGEFMPFLFEKIEDYTELLMPLDLLSENSVLHDLRGALTRETCQDVEVIGWLYQYYISERKDEVFEALKKNQKIEAEDIPAATQLFTPHWIVRYLVENSLGRLWMLNHPNSRLRERMEYYIQPAQEETDFLRIVSPEDLRLLDPACGSGHMLTYAFDLLYAIYEEEGYASNDIPKLILEKNLFGVEIDGRAGALAAFALTMKARAKDRRFFSRGVQPNMCVLENVIFNESELKQYMNAVGRDLFTEPLKETLLQFEQAENFGSLIRPMLTDAGYVRGLLEGKNIGGDLFLYGVHERVLKVLKFAEFLAPRYHIVVANPPYMGSKGFNDELKEFSRTSYPDSKSDTYSMFIERNLELLQNNGFVGMITIPNWMFLTSFENLRKKIISENVISSLVHNGRGIWGSDFGSCSFILVKRKDDDYKGIFKRLFKEQGKVHSSSVLMKRFHNTLEYPEYQVSSKEFRKIPGFPIAYWASQNVRKVFDVAKSLSDVGYPKKGLTTGENETFVRLWHEISKRDFSVNSGSKWYPMTKGGNLRKWFGNNEYVINWENNGKALKSFSGAVVRNEQYYFKEGGSWNDLTMATFTIRYTPPGFINSAVGPMVYADNIKYIVSLLNSKVAQYLFILLCPTMKFEVGSVALFPVLDVDLPDSDELISISKNDWNSFETAWDFQFLPLLENSKYKQERLEKVYESLRAKQKEIIEKMQNAEHSNNVKIIEAYDLQDELTPDVPLEEVTLTCNPYYRYGGKRSEEELEELLRADTMKEFISYAVGCMFGRYSLDKPGLVLANQGERLRDYLKQVPKPTFMPDEDNAIPVLEGEWFNDDIAERFKKFLRVTFGDKHYEENLAFIEEAIGRDIRSYFVKEFYREHVQMYKKRPIYWMFSSPKGSFNALIYMHRYQPDTVSIVLNNYLREYIKKLNAHKSQLERTSVSGSASQSQKTRALREITQVNRVLSELKEYEKDLYALASQKIKIDLDDGVKVNYTKFGSALAKIAGL